jgi:hypothetical protein
LLKKISDLIRYDTDTILADANLAIDDPMQSVVDGHLRIEPLYIDWQELPADANNAYQSWPMISRNKRCY